MSTLDQDLGIQRTALKAAGCRVIRAEKASGSRRSGRTELQVLFDFVQQGNRVKEPAPTLVLETGPGSRSTLTHYGTNARSKPAAAV